MISVVSVFSFQPWAVAFSISPIPQDFWGQKTFNHSQKQIKPKDMRFTKWWRNKWKIMEYSISLQALFPFKIGIQALMQFVVLFDILSCLVSRAHSFCLSKSSEINRFSGLYFLYSYHSSLLCDFRLQRRGSKEWGWKLLLFRKMAFMEKGPLVCVRITT